MTGYEDVRLEVSLPVGDKVRKVDAEVFLQVAAATADGETVSFIVDADNESFLVFTIVINCHFFSRAEPERKG